MVQDPPREAPCVFTRFKDSTKARVTCSKWTFSAVCVCVCSLWHTLESTSPANETQRIYFRQLLDGLQVLQQLSGLVYVRARPVECVFLP